MRSLGHGSVVAALGLVLVAGLAACGDAGGRPLGDPCVDDGDCASGYCVEQVCASTSPRGLTPWNVSFEPMIDASSCAGTSVMWSSQNVLVDGRGHFASVWAPDQPETAIVIGTLAEDAFDASFACVGKPEVAAGALSATPVGQHYEGTFSFGEQRGRIIVTQADDATVDLAGTVVDGQTQAPVAGALVSVSVDAVTSTTTRDDGTFYLQTTTQAAYATTAYTLSVTAQGYADYAQSAVWGDHPRGLQVTLQRSVAAATPAP